eukprot:GHVU01116266.1.p1 GENE.GHVU01116266.1~~GHVU01116266.1.p1  ORF type:complete len:109 (-),score=1.76 GHVU01116266.1:27-353(-)
MELLPRQLLRRIGEETRHRVFGIFLCIEDSTVSEELLACRIGFKGLDNLCWMIKSSIRRGFQFPADVTLYATFPVDPLGIHHLWVFPLEHLTTVSLRYAGRCSTGVVR